MPTYGYIRTSRDQEPGHPGSDPHVQRRQLVEVGVGPARIYADLAASGAGTTTAATSGTSWTSISPRATCWWLLPSTDWGGATSRPCGRSTTCSAAASGCGPWPTTRPSGRSTWTPIPTRPRPSWATSLPAWRPTWPARSGRTSAAGPGPALDSARARGVELGRPRRLTNEQLIAIRQDMEEGMPVAAVARKYGVARSTLRSTLSRTE